MHARQLAAQKNNFRIQRQKIDLKKCQTRSSPYAGILWKRELASRVLDCDFHEPGRAEKALGSSVDRFDSTLGESGRLEGKPKKNACIEQAIHSPHSASSLSLNEANAVSGMWNGLSIISPTFGRWATGFSFKGTSRATGFLPRAMRISNPFSTSAS